MGPWNYMNLAEMMNEFYEKSHILLVSGLMIKRPFYSIYLIYIYIYIYPINPNMYPNNWFKFATSLSSFISIPGLVAVFAECSSRTVGLFYPIWSEPQDWHPMGLAGLVWTGLVWAAYCVWYIMCHFPLKCQTYYSDFRGSLRLFNKSRQPCTAFGSSQFVFMEDAWSWLGHMLWKYLHNLFENKIKQGSIIFGQTMRPMPWPYKSGPQYDYDRVLVSFQQPWQQQQQQQWSNLAN